MNFLSAIVGGFASGVFLRSLFYVGWPVFAFLAFAAALWAAAFAFKSRQAYALGALFFVFVCLGGVRTAVGGVDIPQEFAADIGRRVSYSGVVTSDPDLRENHQRLFVRVHKGETETVVLAAMPLAPVVHVGDRVRVSGTLSEPEAFETENGRVFRYDKYLEVRGARLMIQYGSIRIESPALWYSLPALFARIKHAFLDGLARTVPEPYSALGGGIVIGGKSGLGEELQSHFLRSGLIHIVVLSGYNIMIVAQWAMMIAAFVGLTKRVSVVSGAIALVLLVCIAGITASAVRAALMALIALYGRMTGRTYAAGRALLAAIFLMLLWNPLYLVYDPGFGLSITATAGLIWLAPIIETRLAFIAKELWRTIISTTLAAQVAVLPLLLYNTGNLSFVALPANLLAAPAVPLTMGFSALAGFIGILFGNIAPIAATIAGFPALFLTWYLTTIARLSSELPFAAITIEAFPFVVVLAAYAAMIYFAFAKRSSMTPQFTFAKNAST